MNNPNLLKQQFTYETPNVVSSGIPQFTHKTPNVVSSGIPQELNRSLSNILNKSVDENILNKIRDLDPNSVPPTPTILPHSISQPYTNTTTPVYSTINRSIPRPNPLHANTGLYFRDILKQPEESVSISQSIRTRGTRFSTSL